MTDVLSNPDTLTIAMKEHIAILENIMQQDRVMRHDRRHFETLLQTLLQEGNTQEALKCLNERLNQEPHGVKKYCENTTLNAAITHYLAIAEKKSIKVNISATIPADLNVDEMQLAIVISNLIENAIHACEKVPENERRINIIARYKSQLLFEISNSCVDKIKLDEEGHPFSNEEDHGIGTRSVLSFINQTEGEIRYIAEEKIFKVRMLVS
ncbi:sensor histidine kinase [Butyrivibrio sp. XPD2006]|uniref:sensor histidine kinase n=1 Tax=Butyrivibrio sp. XPD2006 TaxID=1280668 RepID=UPI0003B5C816|nr:ATP-binding protein [Butyrivibrio sp. XPD2006]